MGQAEPKRHVHARREHWQLPGAGTGIHWPDLDEDLSVEGLHRHTREPLNHTIHRMIKRTQVMPMETISANELKTAGIGAIAKALNREPEVGLSVRGQLRYVVMPAAAYQRLRDCELEIALQETRADLAAGRFHAGTVEDHLRRLDGMAEDTSADDGNETQHP